MSTRMDAPHKNGRPQINVTSELLDRAPPHNIEAERSVIGSILLDPRKIDDVAAETSPDDFHDDRHRRLLRHLLEMRGGPIDLIVLIERLKQAGEFDAVGGSAYLAEVAQSVPVADHAGYHARIVRQKAELRAGRDKALELLQDIYSGRAQPGGLFLHAAEQFKRIADRSGGIDFSAMTVADLVAERHELDYLVDGILAAKQPCLIFGPQKVLKTNILLDLAISLALGGRFLGYFYVPRSVRTAVMTGESGMPVIQETLLRIMDAAGCSPGQLGNLLVTDKLPRFGDPEHVQAMRRFILDNELEAVAVDPAYLCMPGDDAGNLFAQGKLLRGMNEVFAETGATLILVHHAKKNIGADPHAPPELGNAAWSGFSEWARQWIMLGRREPYRPGTGDHRLWLSVGGSAGHSGLWALDVGEGPYQPGVARCWSVSLSKADEARRDAQERRQAAREAQQQEASQKRLDGDRRRIVDVMVKFPVGETKSAIGAYAGLNTLRLGPALASLIEDGTVVPVHINKGNHKTPKDGYRLKGEV